MDEQYLIECKENALWKKKLELEILHMDSIALPVESTSFENYAFLNPESLESRELVMEWIRDTRLNLLKMNNSKNILFHQVSSHEAFIGLYALNKLRKNKNPNFLYFHGAVEIKTQLESYKKESYTYYTLSEDLFKDEDIFEFSFRDICEKENWISILNYYLSLLLSLSNANKDIMYANYDLNLDNIMMKSMNSAIFDVEYNFGNKSIWITNYGYVPTITRFSKSYCNIPIDDIPKSFGYNNVSQLPFEPKGIYCDRGFVISDAYKILMEILETTYKHNNKAYINLKRLSKFFFKDEPTEKFSGKYFIPYYDDTSKLDIDTFISFILRLYPEFLSFKPKNDVLRCIGNNLEIKSKTFNYYSVKNTIQLYDFIKYYTSLMDEYNDSEIITILNNGIQHYNKFYEKENTVKEYNRNLSIEFNLFNHNKLFIPPDSIEIYNNESFLKTFKSYTENCIYYYNCWERLNVGMKIYKYLKDNSELFKFFDENFKHIYDNNIDHYNLLYQNLIEYRTFLRKNMDLFLHYKNQIIFLETLE